jgi:hypothetical protein
MVSILSSIIELALAQLQIVRRFGFNLSLLDHFDVKIHLGGITVISGEHIIEMFAISIRRARRINEKKAIQNYVVIGSSNSGRL